MNGKVHVMDHPLVAHKLTVLGTAYGKLVAGHGLVVAVMPVNKGVGLPQRERCQVQHRHRSPRSTFLFGAAGCFATWAFFCSSLSSTEGRCIARSPRDAMRSTAL